MAPARDDEVRERLRAIRVFDDDLPGFDTATAPDHPAELFAD